MTSLVNRGVELRKQGKVDEAISLYKKAIEIDPKNLEAHFDLGHALVMEKKNYSQAYNCFERCVEIDPKFASGWNEIGLCKEHLNDLKGAEAAFKKAIGLDSTACNYIVNLGYLYRDQGRLKEARECFKKASCLPEAKAPGNEDIRQNLDYLNKKLSQTAGD